MTNPQILAATSIAAFLYVVSPGPAFLALFTLAASRGRLAGAKFICGHLVGDVSWGALAVAAIVGANRIGPALFEALGFGCGLYLIYLGARAILTPPIPSNALPCGPDGKLYIQKIELAGRRYLAPVFVDVDRSPAEVVTAYRTSKIDKYWRRQS